MLASFVAVAGVLAARGKVRETTLMATWWWCLAAILATVGVEIVEQLGWLGSESLASPWHYAARTLLLCPTISLVGAKRPQAGPWNFIVLSLWAILALPAAQALLLSRGQPLEVHFHTWFLPVLSFLTLINLLPTRYALESLLATLGQLLLLADYLPLPWSLDNRWTSALGMIALASAAVSYAARPSRSASANPLDRLWLDFRDQFGLFWALRVQERLIDAAQRLDWPVTLTWSGWVTRDGQPITAPLSDEVLRSILIAFRGLLRRFVSNDWIERRTE